MQKQIKLVFMVFMYFNIGIALFSQDWKLPVPKGMAVEDGKVIIVPESERYMNFVIFGLWPNSGKYYFLPEIDAAKGMNKKQLKEVQKQFYWLNYELSHGRPIRSIPKYSHLYVALPDRKYVPESRGGEKELFLSYIKDKCGFTDYEIKHRVHFFKSNIQLEWAQDACKVIGREENGRVILAYSEGDNNPYIGTVRNLEKSFPKDFKLVKVDNSLSAEGGDEDLIWTAPGNVAFLAGRNRAKTYLERKYGEILEDKNITKDQIEEARAAFKSMVYGADVIFMPEKVLADPSLGSKETFHLDMISTTMPIPDGKGYRVFIPTYGSKAYDAIALQELDPKVKAAAQNEYDQAAAQFKDMGYDVVRLKFNDHPVRSPVNIGRFRNKETGKYTVLLGKYPDFLPLNAPETPQAKINTALDYLNNVTTSWLETKSENGYINVKAAINNLWKVMDEVCEAPNPVYQAQYDIFKMLGYEVITIPVYAWGAGGLHCQMMY